MKDLDNDFEQEAFPPAPKVKKTSGPSLVWLIPLLTALVGGWLIYKTVTEKGPLITITFKTAEGIEGGGKTKVKYKDIQVGVVDSVHFSKDFSHVLIKVRMEKESEPLLRRDTHFWVVRPRLGLRGATGLSTLLSGAYIELEPGQGAPQRHFVGLDAPPVVKADVLGKKIVLVATKLGSLDGGSPIYYQGILAGEVHGWELGSDRKSILVHAFIRAPYDKLVRSNTRFWNVSGMDVTLNADGLRVHMESIESLVYGGIAFETPDGPDKGKENVEGLVFTLHDNYQSIHDKAYTKKITLILFFEDSVRGLQVGAPVEFKGIKVGSVKDVHLEFDSVHDSFRIPVLIELEPERIIQTGGAPVSSLEETLKILVNRGLRAQLQTGSLLTGQLFVDLGMHPETPVRLMNAGGPYLELPTIPGTLEQLTTSLKGILAKIEKLNIEKIGTELLETLEGANRLAKGAGDLINKPELKTIVRDLQESVHSLKGILRKVDQRAEPIAANLELALSSARRALEKIQGTLDLVDKVLQPDSPLQYRFLELTGELAETARSIRTLVDLLERKPNAVIFGKDAPGEK